MTEHGPIQASRRLARRIGLLLTPAVYNIVNAAPAWAAGGAAVGSIWIGVTDSAGVPLGAYGLSLNNGSLTDVSAAPSALGMHWFYGIFLSIIGLSIFLVDSVLSFQWLAIISEPLDFMGTRLTAMVHSPSVLLAVGFAAACVVAINVVLGKVGRAASQTTVAVLLAYLAVALGNQPVSELVGPSGALAVGRDMGIEIVGELSGKPLTGDQAVTEMTQQLADHFARTPTLAWNFGADLDAAPYNCGAVWSTAITTGPLDKVKDAVKKGCPHGEELHEYAMSDPPNRKVVAFFAIVFALTMLLVFACLSGLVVVLGLSAIFWAMVAIVGLVIGWIPGGSQTLAIKAGLGAVASFVGMTIMVALVGITGLLVSALFSATGDVAVAMPMVPLLMLALFVALWRVRRRITERRNQAVETAKRFAAGGSESGHAQAPGQADSTVPTSTQNVRRLTRGAVKTGAKYAVTTVAPEAAPLLGAGEQLQHRLNAKNLKQGKRSGAKASNPSPTASAATQAPAAAPATPPKTRIATAAASATAITRSPATTTSPAPTAVQGTAGGTATSPLRPAAVRAPRPAASQPTDLRTPTPPSMPADSTEAPVASPNLQVRHPSPAPAGTSSSRPRRDDIAANAVPQAPRPALHWAIQNLSKLEDHDFDDENSFTEFYSDIRAQFTARTGQR